MNAREAIKLSIGSAQFVTLGYLEDLTDEQLMMRPHPKCNHINWQFGHLIASEREMVEGACPGAMPPLPAGFEEKYNRQTAASDDPALFCTKAELLAAFHQQRAATLAALDKLSDSDLDKPGPESMRSYAPTIASLFELQGGHYLMHAGQWVIVRRQLGKPALF